MFRQVLNMPLVRLSLQSFYIGMFSEFGFFNLLVLSDQISLQFVFPYSNSRLYSRLFQLRTFTGGILVALIQLILLSGDSFFSIFNPLMHNVPKWSDKL